jgi:hypothetical protein
VGVEFLTYAKFMCVKLREGSGSFNVMPTSRTKRLPAVEDSVVIAHAVSRNQTRENLHDMLVSTLDESVQHKGKFTDNCRCQSSPP